MDIKNLLVEALRGVSGDIVAAIEASRSTIEADLNRLYDKYIQPIDIPVIPEPLESKVVDPLMKKLVVKAALARLDQAVEQLKKLQNTDTLATPA